MNPLRVDRILVLTGTCLLLIFLGFDWLAPKVMPGNDLGQVAALGTEPAPEAEDLLQQAVSRAPVEPRAAFPFTSRDLEFGPKVAFEEADLLGFEDRRSREDRMRRTLAPPVGLRWRRVPEGVRIEWSAGAHDDALAREVAADPLLRIGYRVYRWRVGEDPAVIATGTLDVTSCVDADLGLRGGRVFYAVATVLESRIGDQDTLIESERSDVLIADLEDDFDLRLVGGDASQATVEVVPRAGGAAHAFTVSAGQPIGGIAEDGARIDTGWTVVSIDDQPAVREERVRRPVFNPDGSRAQDDTGFLFREEVRKMPVRRLTVHGVDGQGAARSLTLDRP